MTRPLRRAHRAVWLALVVLLPALLGFSLWSRRQPPVNPNVRWERFP